LKFQRNSCPPRAEGTRELSLSGATLTQLMQDVLSKRSPFRFQARGFSMSPFIKDGDVITVFPLLSVKPHFGDVVAFIRPKTESIIIHRVVGRKGNSFFIKGDNTSQRGELISRASILGLVTEVKRHEKRIVLGFGPERLLIA